MTYRTILLFVLLSLGGAGCASIGELTSPCACLEQPINAEQDDFYKSA